MHARADIIPTLLLLQQMRGSVLPKALGYALPCACLALTLKLLVQHGVWQYDIEAVTNAAAYRGFSLAMGFLLIFRSSQAYERYWEGFTAGHRMIAWWFDAASAILAFCTVSKADARLTVDFEQRFIRLVSLLHAAAVGELSGLDPDEFSGIDPMGLDEVSRTKLSTSHFPVQTIFYWLMQIVSENIGQDKVMCVAPPILSRAYQEFANGMVAYHDALRIQTSYFPFAYSQILQMLLLAHWCVTPFAMCTWTDWPSWVFILTLVQTLVFWGLLFIAHELEFPFRVGRSNYAAQQMHAEFTQELLCLITRTARKTPQLSQGAELDVRQLERQAQGFSERKLSATAQRIFQRNWDWDSDASGEKGQDPAVPVKSSEGGVKYIRRSNIGCDHHPRVWRRPACATGAKRPPVNELSEEASGSKRD